MRASLFLALFTFGISAAAITGGAWADESVSGTWRADLGNGVIIDMVVKPDGAWSSATVSKKQVVRQMRGTYKQTPSGAEAGTIVFTPTQSKVKTGSVGVETDDYEIAEGGKQLKLTSDGDTMVFKKREKH